MDSRGALHALVLTKLHASHKKYGWRALGAFVLMVALAAVEESWVETLGAWLSGFTAFFCFACYAGDSKEIERLEQWRTVLPPSLPLAPVTRNDEALINAYGRVLQHSTGKPLIRLSHLPSSKSRLKRVLAACIQQANCREEMLILEEGYLDLSRFQPLPDSNSNLPLVVSAEERLCLLEELAVLKRSCTG